jgi:hypothetical protein
MLGHASAATALDVDADLFDDDLDAVAVRLDHAAVSTEVVKMWSGDDSEAVSGAGLAGPDPRRSGLVGRTGLEPVTDGL